MQSKILIVDDDPATIAAITAILDNQGHQLDSAASGAEALKKIEQTRPDVVLLDVMMPGMDGLSVCRQIRARPENADLLIYMITALDEEPFLSRALEAGADHFLNKPLRARELSLRMKNAAILGRHRQLLTQRRMVEAALEAQSTLEDMQEAAIAGWSQAMDLRDRETEDHTRRVTELALQLGRRMGLDEEALVHLRRGAMLHDIGKIGVPDAILRKSGPLTPEEMAIMKQHPRYARQLLENLAYLRPAAAIPYAHHEKWDGSGYPEGLAGEAIPLPARIFAVVDVWDALTSDRPYRPAWPRAQVVEHIRAGAGAHFDPRVAEEFLEMIAQGDPQPAAA